MRFLYVILCLCFTVSVFTPVQASMYAGYRKAQYIQIHKSKRLMILYDRYGKRLKHYRIALGKNPIGHKQREGDSRTPEGRYYIENRNPDSSYHLSLKISYPNMRDIFKAQINGVSPGGMIMIHGLPNGKEWISGYHTNRDWTDGCVAVNNREIREIWRMVDDGTPVDIYP